MLKACACAKETTFMVYQLAIVMKNAKNVIRIRKIGLMNETLFIKVKTILPNLIPTTSKLTIVVLRPDILCQLIFS